MNGNPPPSGTVSVIIPVFNRPDMIIDAVRTTLEQTYTDLEVIIVDDGSTDATASVVDQLVATDPRLKACHRNNGGPSAARNTGVGMATGTWLSFHDSDDLMHPERIAIQVAAIQQVTDPAVVMGAQVFEIDPNVQPPPSIEAIMATPPPWFYSNSILLSRSLFNSIGGYEESLRLGEDTDLLMRLQRADVILLKTPDALITRRLSGDNLIYEISSPERLMLELLLRNLRTDREAE